MPPAPPRDFVNSVLSAIEASGGSGIYLSDSLQTHPREFGLHFQGKDYNLWVYVWTVTHAGREDPDEYRIQKTAAPPLPRNPNGPTLLMGYYPEYEILAGFDYEQDRDYSEGSPSSYIHMEALDSARENGVGFYESTTGKISVGVRPDHFLFYAFNAVELHREGATRLAAG